MRSVARITTMSACRPGVRVPIWSCSPTARAPWMVASSSTFPEVNTASSCGTSEFPAAHPGPVVPKEHPHLGGHVPAALGLGVARQTRPDAALQYAYLAATRCGGFEALVKLLDPDVGLRADGESLPDGIPAVIRGAQTVARGGPASSARARFTRPAPLDGTVGLVMTPPADSCSWSSP